MLHQSVLGSQKDGSYVPANRSFYSYTASHQGWRHDHQRWTGSVTSTAFSPQTLLSMTNQYSAIQGQLCLRLALYASLERSWHPTGHQSCRLYKAAVLTSLLYGCELWVLYCRHVAAELEQFHMFCLRRIAHVKWQDHIPNTEVLQICSRSGIEAFLISVQLRWTAHVIRTSENTLPNQAFYSQLEHGTRSRGGQRKRYKDMLMHNLKACSIDRKELETLAEDRSSWRAMCKAAVNTSSQNESQS